MTAQGGGTPLPQMHESPTETRARLRVRRLARTPFVAWFFNHGWVLLFGSVVVFGVAAVILGPAQAYDVAAGLTAPDAVDGGWLPTTAAYIVSAAGWLVVPALVGGIAGYLVSVQVSESRSVSFAERVQQRLLGRGR